MQAVSNNKKTFLLSSNGEDIGQIIYHNLYFLKAEILLPNSEKYALMPEGFFGSNISILKNQVEIGSVTMSWNGQILIRLQEQGDYTLKMKTFFSNTYLLLDSKKTQLLEIETKFNWRSYQLMYDIGYHINKNVEVKDALLLLLSIYAANLFVSSLSGANTGMM